MATVKPPATVEVGSLTFRIHASKAAWDKVASEIDDYSMYGVCFKQTCDIYLRPDVDVSLQRETLMHELMHAVEASTGYMLESQRIQTHDFVKDTAPVVLDMLRRNPDLRAYLFAR
jgi:Zn-dependent peptidase ImmA (M78 family)